MMIEYVCRRMLPLLLTIPLCIVSLSSASAENYTLEWSTFLGGFNYDEQPALAIDSSGAVYVAGHTRSRDFPTTSGAFDESYGDYDVFVSKLNSDATALEYSTFLGSWSYSTGIAVDLGGCAYVTGVTGFPDFPTTSGAFDESHNGNIDVFVTKLNSTGNDLVYSTFLGTSDDEEGWAITLDSSGSAYVAGHTYSTTFPTTSGVFDESQNGGWDVFVTKLNPSGNGLLYSTFLGGSWHDYGYALVACSAGSVYVTGETASTDFPTSSGAFDEVHNEDDKDVFVSRLNSSGTELEYSTFLGGGSDETAWGITVDSSGCSYVSGQTDSIDFPVTSGALDQSHNGGWDVFIAKLNPGGTELEYSTFLGGNFGDLGRAIAVDLSGAVYVTGMTIGSTFPTTSGAFDESHNGSTDVFVAKLNSGGTGLEYSTFLGGNHIDFPGYSLAVDSYGSIYVTGETWSADFPITSGAFSETYNGERDIFISKLTTNSTVFGTVTFQYPGWATEHFVRIDYQVRTPGLPPPAPLYEGTLTVCLTPGNPATSNYGIIDDIPDGTYDVALKHHNHIADMKTVVISGGKATGVDFTLWAGDADGDDEFFNTVYPDDPGGDNDVDLADYYTLFYQYHGGLPLTAGYNADFDCDGDINLDDYYGLFYGYQNARNPGNWY